MAKNLYNLTAVTTVNDSDLLHVNQGGVSSDRKVTKQNLLKEVNSSISSINSSLTNTFRELANGMAGGTLTFNIGAASRILLMSFGSSNSVMGMWLISRVTSGNAVSLETIKQGSSLALTVTAGAPQVVFSNSNTAGVFIRAIVLTGSISLAS